MLFFWILTKLEFSRQVFEKQSISDFMTIHRVGDEMFHADGQTERHDEDNSRFSQFCEGAENH